MGQLLNTLPQQGTVTWIGLRPGRRAPVELVTETIATIGTGLAGDRFLGTPESKWQVTLIQAEHLRAVASFLGSPHISSAACRAKEEMFCSVTWVMLCKALLVKKAWCPVISTLLKDTAAA